MPAVSSKPAESLPAGPAEAIMSPLRHLDPQEIGVAARVETRNREVHHAGRVRYGGGYLQAVGVSEEEL